jgi:copper transporter 1
MVQLTLSWLLMLVFMAYNSWLCLCVVLGAGAGYFVFGVWRQKSADVNEAGCH